MSDPSTLNQKDTMQAETFTVMVASKQGWLVTPDTSFAADLVEGLKKNWNRYGYFLCPCRDTEGNRAADTDVICPCRYAKEDIAEFGHCYCSLYWSPAFAASGKEPSGLSERRPWPRSQT